jgi:hypothetical protein
VTKEGNLHAERVANSLARDTQEIIEVSRHIAAIIALTARTENMTKFFDAVAALAVVSLVIVLAGPFSLELAALLMAIWPSFSKWVRDSKLSVAALAIGVGIASLNGWDQPVRELSIINLFIDDARFSHRKLDAAQSAAYAAQMILLSLLFAFGRATGKEKPATNMQVLFAALLALSCAVALKWAHFDQVLLMREGINRWGIRLFGAGPNNEMTILALLACSIIAAASVVSLVNVARDASTRLERR